MAKLYNNPLNLEIGQGWAGRQGTYANGRKRIVFDFTVNGVKTKLDWKKYSENKDIKAIENDDDAQAAIKELIIAEFKLNEPDNIKFNFAKPFAQFDSKVTGLRAAMRLFKGKGYLGRKDKRGNSDPLNTLEGIIRRFAPRSENDTEAYIDFVVQEFKKVHKLGENFTKDTILTKADVPNMTKFFLIHENHANLDTPMEGTNQTFREYYLSQEALDDAWKVAAWSSGNSYPMSTTEQDLRDGYNNKTDYGDDLQGTNEKGEALDLYSGLKLAFAETAAEEVKPITKEQIETSSVDASGKTILPDFGDAPVEKDYEVGASLTQIGDEDYAADLDGLFKAEDFEVGGQADVEFSTNISEADPNYRFHIRKGGQKIYMGKLFGEDVLGYTGTSKIGKHTVTYGAEKVGEGSTQFIEGSGQHGKTNISYGLERNDDTTKGFVRLKGKL